ncbi:MAG: preprotein translocase subunit YajC [Ignavibacteriae bacterium]|nr:preprotein translocase subunit YajC [Ignavibacteriota bacterium]
MAPPPGGNGGGGGMFGTLMMFALIILIFYFMILRPQQKRQKERQKILESVKKGDKIITAGGLHGTIAGLDEKTFLLEVGDKVKLKFDRSAVGTIIKEGESETKGAK